MTLPVDHRKDLYFQIRVLNDEARLERIFSDGYRQYRTQVPRWLPFFRIKGLN